MEDFNPMTFSALEECASVAYRQFHWAMKTIRKNFPAEESCGWDYDSETDCVRQYNLPDMTWETFQEPNDELQ